MLDCIARATTKGGFTIVLQMPHYSFFTHAIPAMIYLSGIVLEKL